MKQVALLIIFCMAAFLGLAQMQVTEPDKSPMDMSYYPSGYPILKFQSKNPPAAVQARILYSRPQKNGRSIFGDIVKYNEVWRLGANETPEIDFYRDVTIGGKKVAKGRYTMYAIPQANKWTIILNKTLDTWGAFSYDAKTDLLRVDVSLSLMEIPVEYFTMVFDNTGTLIIMWDNVKVALPIKYGTK